MAGPQLISKLLIDQRRRCRRAAIELAVHHRGF
jgi:hypothetical protein